MDSIFIFLKRGQDLQDYQDKFLLSTFQEKVLKYNPFHFFKAL